VSLRRPPYRLFAHTADIGAAVRGRTLRALFDNSAEALLDIGGDRSDVRKRRRAAIAVSGSGLDDLLVRWLSEILFLEESRGWRFRACKVSALDRRAATLRGVAIGEPFDPERHSRMREVKAVTYHQLRITRGRAGWHVRIVFDV
jgi:SHS2 domain-containing protein